MNANEKKEIFIDLSVEHNKEILGLDGFEEALIGHVINAQGNPVALYDNEKFIQCLHDNHGMNEEDAIEYHEYNTMGSLAGIDEESRPLFCTLFEEKE